MVNVFNDPDKRKQQPGVAATINGQQISIAQLAEECITRHGVDVLEAEINFLLLQQALKNKQRSVSGDEIDTEVARAAEAYGFLTQDQQAGRQTVVARGDRTGIDGCRIVHPRRRLAFGRPEETGRRSSRSHRRRSAKGLRGELWSARRSAGDCAGQSANRAGSLGHGPLESDADFLRRAGGAVLDRTGLAGQHGRSPADPSF